MPNYSQYSVAELYQALNNIVADRFPETLAALEHELNLREPQSKYELEECYYRLDKERWPAYAARLRQQINDLGGFPALMPETTTGDVKYRTFWRRVGAHVIDWLLFAGPALILLLAIGQTISERPDMRIYLEWIFDCAFLTYFILMHAKFGQTVGKMAAGVKIVDVSEERPISFTQALLRDSVPVALTAISIAYFVIVGVSIEQNELTETSAILARSVSFVAFLWGIAELVTMLLNRKRRAVHDFIARSVVIRVP